MYHYHVKDLLESTAHFTSDEEEENEQNLSSGEIRALILQQLKKENDTPQRQYLMQCADWEESEWTKGKWVAYSPISSRYSGGVWPLYDIGGLEFGGTGEIEFNSWKGDYDPETRGMPYGNLPYEGVRKKLTGTVWTRGE